MLHCLGKNNDFAEFKVHTGHFSEYHSIDFIRDKHVLSHVVAHLTTILPAKSDSDVMFVS